MRDEQDLLTRRKHAMLNQLTSLSALAVETAENLPTCPRCPTQSLPISRVPGGRAVTRPR
jgi:hypothetical protein